MAEYIVEYPDDLVAEGYVENFVNVHERIVRCINCKRWNGIENALGQRICDRSGKFCKSNGFCAWGEVKNG